jgi:drug/metabolite transporter (DMT)-like permease
VIHPRHIAGYAFLAVAWGLSFLVLLKVVEAFGWVAAVSFRGFVAAFTLWLAMRLTGGAQAPPIPRRHAIVVGGTTVALQLLFLSFATPLIGTAMAAILVATIPLFSLLIGYVWKLEKARFASIAGLGCGFCGLVLLVGFPAVPLTPLFLIGVLASLISAFSAAFGSNYVSRNLPDADPRQLTMAAFFWGGLLSLPLLPLVPVPGWPGPIDWLYLVISASVMSALTYVIYFWLVREIGATRAISVEFAVTLVAASVGIVFLGEPVTWPQILGGFGIIIGCALVLGLFEGRNRPVAD